MRGFLVMLMATATVAIAQPARAQINPFHGMSQGGMSKADMDAVVEASTALNTDPAIAVGKGVAWQNPASSKSGTVTVTAIRTIKGMPCHALTTSIDSAKYDRSSEWSLTWCQIKSGAWKILN